MKKISCVVVSVLAALSCRAALLDRVEAQADKVATAYGETWNTFYGDGYYKTLMTASLDVRPDGTPNIILDKAARKMTVTIRLAVNEANYKRWQTAAHARFAAANMSYRFSEFEDPEGRMIGGKNYRFGENEEASIKRWEAKAGNGYKASLTVHVQLVDKAGQVLRENFLPIKEFQRLGYASYPIPLHNLNRLQELPRSRFKWFDSEKEPTADSHVEDAYARIAYSYLTQTEITTLEDVRCAILEENGPVMRERREAAERPAREAREAAECRAREAREARERVVQSLLADMIAIPEKNYLVGKTEVTQAQWEAVMGTNPAFFDGPDRPVERVSWNDCQEFIEKLNGLPQVKKAKLWFRLPTEEEWEHACRAGSTGNRGHCANGEEGSLDAMGWYRGNSGNETHPVAQKEPNAFGFYDMHGNVWEWTSTAGVGNRVYRGGGWEDGSGYCTAGVRYGYDPNVRNNGLGFRLAASHD